jgi:hypothetical protein
MRVLGVWVDPKLQWKEHVKKVTRKGNASFEALSRLSASTWGPSMRRSRLIYSAVVRPAMLYGSQVWGARDDGEPIAKSTLQPIQAIQNKCLRRVTGGYKRTPVAALEKETGVPPCDIYIDTIALQRAITVRAHPVEAEISRTLNDIWHAAAPNQRIAVRPRPRSGPELLQSRALAREIEMRRYLAHHASIAQETQGSRTRPRRRRRRHRQGGYQHRYKPITLISMWADLTWKQRWEKAAQGKRASTWHTPWGMPTIPLYEGLNKAEATALFLLRVEVLGLNAWLASVQVPDILPRCACGWRAHTVRHVLLHCPQYDRTALILETRTESLLVMLSRPDSARAAARWFIQQNVLEQFRVAKEITGEDIRGYAPLPEIGRWI